ncbi:MAG: ParB N-terminal domain-containing protein [Amaricoccus sp.]|uniref:ParB/RepB/Spo0J family partition protein n=1 Tax=Amaricoccus sp. TaxID=1872485 RepID=UPI003316040E
MARRRLTPTAFPLSGPAADVPRAEHFDLTMTLPRPASSAPIARVAAEAASTAALDEMADTLRRARDEGRLVLDLALESIAPDHLARDRLPVEDEEMAALRESLRAHGQRTPIEVTPLDATPRGGALPYGLISGWRRLTALKALRAETGEARFATVQALVRRPETAQDAYVAMVEENEIRLGLSQYERARVAARATERGVFPSEKAALLALFSSASRAKRSRIRGFLEIYHALDGALRFPTHLPERLGLDLVERLRAGEGPGIAAALAAADPKDPEAELATLAACIAPKPLDAPPPDLTSSEPEPARVPDRGRALLPGVDLRAELRGHALILRLTGDGVTPQLCDRILALLATLDGA